MPLATPTARKPSKRGGQTGGKRARHVAEGSFEEVTVKGQGMRVRGVPDDLTDDEDTIFYEQPPSYPRMSRPEQGGWGNRERGARSRHRTSDDDSCKDDRTCTHEKDMTEDSEGYYPPGHQFMQAPLLTGHNKKPEYRPWTRGDLDVILGKLPPFEKGGQPWIAEFEVQTVQECEKWEKYFPNGSSECNSPCVLSWKSIQHNVF